MAKSKVTISLDTEGIRQEVADAAFQGVLYEVARQVHGELSKKNAFFEDQTGEMRQSFKMSKMRYGTGYIVFSDNPHAWYLEKGHAVIKDGHTIAHVPGKYFMRRAKNRVKRRLKNIIETFGIVLSHERGLHLRKGR